MRLFAAEQTALHETEQDRTAALDRALGSYVATARLALKLTHYPTVPADVELDAAPLLLTSDAKGSARSISTWETPPRPTPGSRPGSPARGPGT
ncbi:hypothetical protein GCM10010517_09060 [Streptosporangium fragile]|uniref:Uncharacterized protein n=1 Tax=Streptosporangium fragile TaxID=46186 RepID=A0ABN3VS72_9ACTN